MNHFRLSRMRCCVPALMALAMWVGTVQGQSPAKPAKSAKPAEPAKPAKPAKPAESALWVMPWGHRDVRVKFDSVAHYTIDGPCQQLVTAPCVETNIVLGLFSRKLTRLSVGGSMRVTTGRGVSAKRRVDDAYPHDGHPFFDIKLRPSDQANIMDTLSVSLLVAGKWHAALNTIVFCRRELSTAQPRLPLCAK